MSQGSHSFTSKRWIFPGLSRTHRTFFFQDIAAAQQYLKRNYNYLLKIYNVGGTTTHKSRPKAEAGKFLGGAANPLPPARESGECCKVPRRSGAEPQKLLNFDCYG